MECAALVGRDRRRTTPEGVAAFRITASRAKEDRAIERAEARRLRPANRMGVAAPCAACNG